VIAGKFKGRQLIGPKDQSFRPTLDRVKESIFNVLGQDLVDSLVLDLFCGTGALGIEAISRGAMRATFVDNTKSILDIARRNTTALGIDPKSKYVQADVFEFLEHSRNFKCNIVFADPPYDKKYGSAICQSLIECNILQPRGIIVLERFKKETLEYTELQLAKTLKFGQTEVDFFIREV